MVQQTDQIEDIIQYNYGTTSIHQLYIVRFFFLCWFSRGLGGKTWSPLHHGCETGGGQSHGQTGFDPENGENPQPVDRQGV